MEMHNVLKTRGPKITSRSAAEPCKCCGLRIKRGVYSRTLRYFVCANPVACAGRMTARRR